jgi:hypothetical protein
VSTYRNKPIVIEAVRIAELLNAEVNNWPSVPDWVAAAYYRGEIVFASNYIMIHTPEALYRGQPEDMLIRGVNGELYPCKPDIFRATYESVNVEPQLPQAHAGGNE